MTQPLAIELNGVSKSFGSVQALREVSLSIASGEFFGLLGPNGAGKTTLMRILCGLLAPDAGEARVFGLRLERWGATSDLGVVPQDIALYDTLTAEGNLSLFGLLRGMSGKELRVAVDRSLDLVGLRERARTRVKGFSGGMKRRLNLAAGLLHRPRLLLLDEPTVGVDPQSRVSIFSVLEELHRSGVTMVYTTHYMEEAERLCRTIAIIDNGSLLASGTLHGLLGKVRTPRFVRVLLRSENERLPSFRKASVSRQGLQAELVPKSDKELPALLTEATNWEGAQRVEVVSPNLETLFLELTGKGLRDA